jgi:electron transfer flavoprotein alpha subunit
MRALVLVEIDGAQVGDVSLEAVTVARSLGGDVACVVVGGLPAGALDQLAVYGATTVHQAVHAAFERYAAAAHAAAVVAAVARSGAEVVVAPGTPRGTEVMAHVAARLDVPMAANVVEVGGGRPVTVVRQVMGGSVREEAVLDGSPALFAVAGHAVEAEAAAAPGDAVVSEFVPDLSDADLRAQVVRVLAAADGADSARLAKARVVVGAGRGAGGPDGFGPAIELAGLLGGVLGVSRAVTAAGWRPHGEQVGQTGTKISPELYIPCGISGAIQHWAGCSSAQTILAVNTDDEAPMVTRARYAVIGDMHDVLPAVIEVLRS